MQKIFPLLFTFFLIPCVVFGQVTFTDFPEHLQLYPRDISSNLATVTAAGSIDLSGVTYSELRLKVYRDGILQATEVETIAPGTGVVPFSITYDIPGELNNYKFEFFGFNGAETMIQSADSVVAGDMYIIYGQSNGEAPMYDGSSSADASSYIRVYGRSINFNINYIDWHVGQGDGDLLSDGNTGQWGLKLARNIIDNQAVPVAIFNGCWGGQHLSFFTRNDADHDDFSTQYGKTLTRLLQTGGDQKVRGFFWFQGENEADSGESTDFYKSQFAALFSDLKEDYTVDQYYMLQIRDGAYFSYENTLPIQEAQRQLADSIPEMELISTNTLQHFTDNVHYSYLDGYEKLGDISYLFINRDIYGGPSAGIATPTISGAVITGSTEITIYTDLSDVLTADAGIESYFVLNGTAATVTGVSILGTSDIVLSLSSAPSGISSISYSTPVGSTNSIVNASDVGLTAFHEFPVGTLPIELLSFDGKLLQDQIELNWITASEKNNSHFDVQRSSNGQAWQSIGLIEGAGNSDENLSYQFIDTNPVVGISRYRLKQVDFDGSSSLSSVVELNFVYRTNQLVSYPNPSNGSFTVLSNLEPKSEIELYILNPMGQILYQRQVMPDDFGSLEVDLGAEWVAGAYILRLKSKDGQNLTTKIMIQ